MKTQFFTFHQNNSFGTFEYDKEKGITCTVIIEVVDADDSVNRAENIGLYFEGVSDGSDCPCCGDRWSRPRSDDGTEVPEYYGEDVRRELSNKPLRFLKDDQQEIAVHYLDGRIEWFY
jgi:hypothetical protein